MAHHKFTYVTVLLVGVALGRLASPAAAQTADPPGGDLPGYDATDLELTLPPAAATPAPGAAAPPPMAEPVAGPDDPVAVAPELIPPGAGALEPIPAYDPTQHDPLQHDLLPLTGDYPAVTESSGTWLERGFWYADTELVMMARTWDDNGRILFQEFDSLENQIVLQIDVTSAPTLIPIQDQRLGESSPGYDGSMRLTLGRFLFRDIQNRDHCLEALFFGGNDLEESVAAEAQQLGIGQGIDQLLTSGQQRNAQGLHVPAGIDGSAPFQVDSSFAFPSFDQATSMQADYVNRFLNWELNYNVSGRSDKDRMELLPSGEWVRRAASNITYDYSAGFRYFDLEEQLFWRATEIRSLGTSQQFIVGDPPNQAVATVYSDTPDGAYRLHTTNDLYGLQLGAGVSYQTDRWSVTLSTKQGFYINDARSRRQLTFTDDNDADENNFNLDLHENGVSYIGTGSIVARYHLRQNLSLRAGWEFMYITGLALAPNEANFNPAVGQQLHLVGDVLYHGVNAGAEFYW
ncbi:hypothetical protein [Botrimarina sp.]|uniref:hypothetical protein n=1 Tax=Botrimarina sp. TaxID=2795802 RepID=UPI0032EAEE11